MAGVAEGEAAALEGAGAEEIALVPHTSLAPMGLDDLAPQVRASLSSLPCSAQLLPSPLTPLLSAGGASGC